MKTRDLKRLLSHVAPYVFAAVVALIVAAVVTAPPAWAGSLQVAPVRVVLTPARAVAAMTIGNPEDTEVAVQAEVFAWSQVDGKDVYEPTRDVLVNPTIFRLAAQAQQIVRVGLRVAAGEREKSYRIFLQQLPRDRAVPVDGTVGVQIQTLLRIGVPIFVPPIAAPKTSRQDVQWRVERSDAGEGRAPLQQLKVYNAGDEHIQLTRLVLRQANGSELGSQSFSQYVLAGQATTVPMALPPLAAGSEFSVEAHSDAAEPLPATRLRVPTEASPR